MNKKKKDNTIKAQLIGFWNDTKNLGRNVVKNIDSEIPKIKKEASSAFISFQNWIDEKKTKKIKKPKEKKTGKRRIWATILLTVFNLLVMIWVWILFFMILIILFAVGIGISFSGLLLALTSLFILLNPIEFMLRNMAMSGLFAGIGLIFMGILFSIGSSKLMKGLSYLIKEYTKLNKRLSRK